MSSSKGFTVIPTAGLDESEWRTVRTILERNISRTTDGELSCSLHFAPAAADMAAAAAAFRAMPPGLALFLYVDRASAASILASERGELAETKKPFVLAVQNTVGEPVADPTAEGADFRGWFKVDIASLTDDLFPLCEDDTLSPFEIGGFVAEDDVWLHHLRGGVLSGAG